MAAAAAATVSLHDEITRLQRLQQAQNHEEVVAAAGPLIAAYPENRDLLLLAIVSLRLRQRIDEALVLIDQLERAHPGYSRMWQERGLCHVARRDAPAAIDALLRAVNINPALPMSWRMLEGLYRIVGDSEEAAVAAAHQATFAQLRPEVVTATALFADGDLAPAEELVRGVLLRHGDDLEAMRLLAKIGMARDVLDDAEVLLAAVVDRAPDHVAARFDYAQCLVQRQKFTAVAEQAGRLLAIDPANPEYRQLAATAAVGLGDHARALVLYRGLLADYPDSPDLNLWLGHALKTVGDVPAAVAAYRAAAQARPDFGDAYWSLANLKRYRFDDEQVTAMRRAEAAPATATVDRIHLCFALGKALEDRGEIAESWTSYDRGNALQRGESRYRPDIIETNTRLQRQVCTPAFFHARAGWGVADRDPIFIVGLPRAGSTLIEQILASHSQVEGTQELPDVQRLVLELQGRDPDLDRPRYPEALTTLTPTQVAEMGRRYLDDTRIYRSGAPRFVDKMPNNFRHIGLIHLMLPNAVIIDARREPMACCFSNLKQLFARGQEFSYSIEDIARYYRTYLELMEHWDRALPARALRVQHEDVVADLAGSVRRILDHAGLPFEQACVDFHTNPRSVRTPSSEQVRQPIFRDGLDQWVKYEAYLEPLREALGDAVERYRG